MSITHFVCYSDSLHCINILNGPPMRFHVYAVLIQDIKELLEQGNVLVNHTLRDGNQCADFFAKLGASSDVEFLRHKSPPMNLKIFLQSYAARIFYLRE